MNDARSQRAAPMTPDDRRAAILEATVPLLRERGVNVTTKELAQVAGVAEGTLFRVFPDKDALVRAAIAQAFDLGPALDELGRIDPDDDLRITLTAAVRVLRRRSQEIVTLMSIAHELARQTDGADGDPSTSGRAGAAAGRRPFHPPGPPPAPDGQHPIASVVEAVEGLLERHSDELRWTPAVCGQMLVSMVFASTRPLMFGSGAALTPEQIVELFLDGALSREATSDPETPC